jgi:uncharacterized membrane protein YGL010W
MDMKKSIETWCSWHRHPINAVLHIIGIPMTFAAGYVAFAYSVVLGAGLFILGYAMQFAGHAIEGNEAGEVRLLKKIFKK